MPLWQPRWRFCLLDCNDEGSLPHLMTNEVLYIVHVLYYIIIYIIGHVTDQPILNALRASAKATNSWLPISLPKPPFLIAAHCRCNSGKLCHQVSTMFVVHFLFSLLCCNTQYNGVVAQHSHQISTREHPRSITKRSPSLSLLDDQSSTPN